jgi:SAM-dependent methyltransferase
MTAGHDPKAIVREGYDRASNAYRGDEFPTEGSGYAYWLSRLTPTLAPGSRVLDLGCGCGVPASRELARCHQVTGVDISPVQIARARRLVPAGRFLCADMAEVEFEPRSFEAAIAFFSLINLPLPEQSVVITRVAGWLVPGGRLLAIVASLHRPGSRASFRGVRGAAMCGATLMCGPTVSGSSRPDSRSRRRVRTPQREPGYAVIIGRRGGPGNRA